MSKLAVLGIIFLVEFDQLGPVAIQATRAYFNNGLHMEYFWINNHGGNQLNNNNNNKVTYTTNFFNNFISFIN